jgi:predicted nuclease of restriction endonuclease-like (RecB) superfamily
VSDLTPNNYVNIITELKNKIKQAKINAAFSVNLELLAVFWEIGNTILQQKKAEGWGAKIIDRLSLDLKIEFPEMKGLSLRSIKYMRAFAEAYPNFPIVQPALAQIHNSHNQLDTIVQQVIAQIQNLYYKLFKIKLVSHASY